MKLSLVLALTLSSVHGWISTQQLNLPPFRYSISLAVQNGGNGDVPVSAELQRTENPCWQDMYDSDDDCLSNIASASFVASKWIQSMPCGAGIEDCDMPTDLQMPETRPEGGVDNVDVMEFLGIKRPEALKAHHDDDDDLPGTT